jgi:uncharacterized membrane protein YeaQ/YmgE (transglycosylase-associated protein family)
MGRSGQGRARQSRPADPAGDHPHVEQECRLWLGHWLVAAVITSAMWSYRRNGTMEIIGVIVAGIIIGLLGKFVAPGDKDNIPVWLTILCGIGGVIIGWFVYTAFGGNGSPGVDWVRWIVAIAISAVLVVVASTVTGRNTSARR